MTGRRQTHVTRYLLSGKLCRSWSVFVHSEVRAGASAASVTAVDAVDTAARSTAGPVERFTRGLSRTHTD